MTQNIKTINLFLPLKMGSVNCYLVEVDSGYILIDTGSSNARRELDENLESAGCLPGNLNLIVLTHGDFDHIGNAVHLRDKYASKIAMQVDDVPMAERGDMLATRKSTNLLNRFVAFLTPRLMGFGRSARFVPDFYLRDRDLLSEHSFGAQVISLPGHSKGSIGILTDNGDLFCGDLFENTDQPDLNSIMDDLSAARASADKLKDYSISTVYPGHGKPFSMASITKV